MNFSSNAAPGFQCENGSENGKPDKERSGLLPPDLASNHGIGVLAVDVAFGRPAPGRPVSVRNPHNRYGKKMKEDKKYFPGREVRVFPVSRLQPGFMVIVPHGKCTGLRRDNAVQTAVGEDANQGLIICVRIGRGSQCDREASDLRSGDVAVLMNSTTSLITEGAKSMATWLIGCVSRESQPVYGTLRPSAGITRLSTGE